MKAKFVVATISRGITEKTPVSVMLHEVAVLKQIHGEGNVAVVDTLPDQKPFDISAAEEYSRLDMAYGVEPETKLSYAERAFGKFNEARFCDDAEGLLSDVIATYPLKADPVKAGK